MMSVDPRRAKDAALALCFGATGIALLLSCVSAGDTLPGSADAVRLRHGKNAGVPSAVDDPEPSDVADDAVSSGGQTVAYTAAVQNDSTVGISVGRTSFSLEDVRTGTVLAFAPKQGPPAPAASI